MSLYSSIRLVFIVGSIFLIFIIANKTKKRTVALILGFVLLISIVAVDFRFPVENSFISFKTVKQAFSYSNKGEIIYTVEGSESGLIVYRDDETIGLCFLPKTQKNRWKIDSAFSFDTVYDKSTNVNNTDYNITIYRMKKTSDYYISFDAWFVNEKPIVSDNKTTDFKCVKRTYDNESKKTYSFYGYVEDIDNYQIQVNGETVDIIICWMDFSNVAIYKSNLVKRFMLYPF
ncbi:hypothetical protein [Ruminococcus bromii]|uniref:hypothetical protein n=1 Tax=Ruminococcus bromii TaxID=40518 RepID=UPI003FD6E5E9